MTVTLTFLTVYGSVGWGGTTLNDRVHWKNKSQVKYPDVFSLGTTAVLDNILGVLPLYEPPWIKHCLQWENKGKETRIVSNRHFNMDLPTI